MGWLQRILGWFRPEPVPPPTRPPGVPSSLVEALNRARTQNGRPALVEDASLTDLAQAQADLCAVQGRLMHGNFAGRMQHVYPGRMGAENLAAGQPDAVAVVNSWMDSPGHRVNMLGDYDHVGVGQALGTAGFYWCACFAQLG